MLLHFTKMHGLGNDFIVIDAIHQQVNLSPAQIAALACRDTGIGFDQCLILAASHDQDIDFFYRIFNADGGEVGQCGNGARCLARFAYQQQLTTKKEIMVATNTTKMCLVINNDDTVTVNFGQPQLNPDLIPLLAQTQQERYCLPNINGKTYQVHALSVGNPHAVIVVNDLAEVNVANIGSLISKHPLFPKQCNAGFMEIIDNQTINLCVYERGCGETKACGSGAVAAAAVGRLYYGLNTTINVKLPGGTLNVSWPILDQSIYLKGPATFVYQGSIDLIGFKGL